MAFRRRMIVLTLMVSAFILIMTVAAPIILPYGTMTSLDGDPGILDGGWEGHGAWGIIYALGDLMCHQDESRSFILNGSQMPMCMREIGFIIGLVVGFMACLFLEERLRGHPTPILGAALLIIMVLEWLMESGYDWPIPRTSSGILAGIGASLIIGWLIYRDDAYNVYG